MECGCPLPLSYRAGPPTAQGPPYPRLFRTRSQVRRADAKAAEGCRTPH
jgi:hypothetical protein